MQAFNWESHKRMWYKDMVPKVADWAKQGFTAIWLPPPSDSVSPQVRCCHRKQQRSRHQRAGAAAVSCGSQRLLCPHMSCRNLLSHMSCNF
jgi:hypothetical protein